MSQMLGLIVTGMHTNWVVTIRGQDFATAGSQMLLRNKTDRLLGSQR